MPAPSTSATSARSRTHSPAVTTRTTSCTRWRRAASGRGTASSPRASARPRPAAGVSRVIYLGGLGNEPSSEHLASRHEVGVALAAGGVPVVELRAAVVLGSGSISFEMLRYLTERLPFMVCPRWVHTEIQPIALDDMVAYLVKALDVDAGRLRGRRGRRDDVPRHDLGVRARARAHHAGSSSTCRT